MTLVIFIWGIPARVPRSKNLIIEKGASIDVLMFFVDIEQLSISNSTFG